MTVNRKPVPIVAKDFIQQYRCQRCVYWVAWGGGLMPQNIFDIARKSVILQKR